ncbi:MAG: dienelactone hydrolase family protein [Verrucomicrobiaceae bacterium]|nr:dienelactone hydrolase family protein [Verrucomicrobiaceae bacterium]
MKQSSATSVTLRLRNGQTFDLTLDKLSNADQTFIKDSAQRATVEEQRRAGLKTGPYAEHLTGDWEKMETEDGLKYHFFAAKSLKADKEYPLCIYLHGASNTGSNLEKREPGANAFASETVYGKNPSIVIAPEAPAGTKAFKDIERRITHLIHNLVDHLPVDRARIYITGYSMGSMGTWAMISAQPDLFAAAVPVGGPLGSTKVESLPKIPIWLHFGELDRGDEFRALSKQLTELNSQFKSTEYPGADHVGFHFKVAKDNDVMEWIFAQRRAQ